MNKKEDTKSVKSVDYSPDELAYRSRLITMLSNARDIREQKHVEFDDMTYTQWWLSNAKAANSYNRPKTEEVDVRIVTGTTKEKSNTLLSALLNYNLEPDINAFDEQEMEDAEFGTLLEDMVRKSRQIELPIYEKKRPLLYTEGLNQGEVFIEESFVEYSMPNKEFTGDFKGTTKKTWQDRVDKVYKYCNSQMICGLNFYPGDIRQPYMELQPYIFTRLTMPRMIAESIYGTWERWKYVPYKVDRIGNGNENSIPYNDWTLEETSEDLVEVIKFSTKWSNEYMIMLNGVMMMPVGFPLSAISGTCEYNVVKGMLGEPIPGFFYAKSVPSKMKVDQAVYDEMLRAIILKTRKSFQPPMANNTGRTLSKNIFYPGTIHERVDIEKLKEIGKNDGVTNAEMGAVQFLKSMIDGKSISPVFEGQSEHKTQTAREIIELKQQSMMKIGIAILGVMNLERDLAWLRLNNILLNWTKAVDTHVDKVTGQIVDKYRTVYVDSELENGQRGKRIIEFTKDRNLLNLQPEQVKAEEELYRSVKGQSVRIVRINPDDLRNLRYTFFINVVPTEKATSDLKKVLFMEMITQGFQLWGPNAFNNDYLKIQWAINNGQDPDRVLAKQQPMQPGMPGAMPGLQMPETASNLRPGQSQVKPKGMGAQIGTMGNAAQLA